MKNYNIYILSLALLLTVSAATPDSSAALANKCADAFSKVAMCMSYATGDAAAPTKECCGSVQEIKSKDPVCLCYFMEQTLNGSDAIKSLGIHEDRLLELPTACKLTNASVSYCPKLLNISANSPEYKIFTNESSLSSSTPPTTTAAGASLPLTNTKSNGHIFEPQLFNPISIVAIIFLCVSCAQGFNFI